MPQKRGETRRGCNLPYLVQPELQAERKHQQNHAELGQGFEYFFVGLDWDGEVRTDDHPCHEIAEDHREAQALEKEGGYGRRTEDERQVFQDCVGVLHCVMITQNGSHSLCENGSNPGFPG